MRLRSIPARRTAHPVIGPSTFGQAVGPRRGIRAAPALQAQDSAESAAACRLRPKPGDSAQSSDRAVVTGREEARVSPAEMSSANELIRSPPGTVRLTTAACRVDERAGPKPFAIQFMGSRATSDL